MQARLCLARSLRFETPLIGDPVSGRRKHVGYVDVHQAVVVIVAPADRHSERPIFHTCLCRYVREFSAFVAIQVVPPEVVGHVQIRVAVVVIVFPGRGQAESSVIHVESRFAGDVGERHVAVVAHQIVRSSIVRVVVRSRHR